MKVEKTNQDLLKKLFESGKMTLYVSLVPYKNNTCIKVYDEENNPLGDIPQEEVSTYINKENIVLFINQTIDDNTGSPIYVLQTID